MAAVCAICQDYLTEEPLASNHNHECIRLECGHLYHRACVKRWFIKSNYRKSKSEKQRGTCPVCKKTCNLSNTLRIFPIGEADNGAEATQKKGRTVDIENCRTVELVEMQLEKAAKQILKIFPIGEADNAAMEASRKKSRTVPSESESRTVELLEIQLKKAEKQNLQEMKKASALIRQREQQIAQLKMENQALKENFKALRSHYRVYSPLPLE